MLTIPGRIPIHIHPFFWVMSVLIGGEASGFHLVDTLSWVVVIFVSILIHEYGHALTALAFKREVHIELIGMGGLAVHRGKKLHLWQEFLIVLNGPLAGFALYLIAAYLSTKMVGSPRANSWHHPINIMLYVNWYWTLLNLCPVYPLDGGRLLGIILESLFGPPGVRAGFVASMILGFVFSVFLFISGRIYAGALFLFFTFENYQSWKNSSHITSNQKNPTSDLQRLWEEANDLLRRGDKTGAKQVLSQLRSRSETGKWYVTATVLLAELLSVEGRFQEAYELLQPIKKKLPAKELRFLHQLAYQNGSWREATELGNKAYMQFPSYNVAYTNAICHASLGELHATVGWLQRSIGDGLPDLEKSLSQKEFDPIRNTPEFQQLRHRHRRV